MFKYLKRMCIAIVLSIKLFGDILVDNAIMVCLTSPLLVFMEVTQL